MGKKVPMPLKGETKNEYRARVLGRLPSRYLLQYLAKYKED